ncbi:hypothetical protein L0F63_006416 [Massospora cicadina]|nr:hypothetical protein L0F63_006416 [Massospora cicadina]
MRFGIFGLVFGEVAAKLHRMVWVAEERVGAPDNHPLPIITINGKFPGPTIRLAMGDRVEVNLINKVGKPFTLHWHGINQKHSQHSDGVPYVTQTPIQNNANYTYTFTVADQAGTFWYHAHTKLDSDVAFGALIVKEPKSVMKRAIKLDKRFRYDREKVIILSELWHRSREEIYNYLTTTPFKSFHTPNSILTNGRTFDIWDEAIFPALPFNEGYSVVKVKPNTRYRLRIIGAQTRSFFTFTIPHHRLTVIEADGTLIRPFEVDHIDINSGMRYSVILQTKPEPANYFMYTTILDGDRVRNGVAILHYKGSPDPTRLFRHHSPHNNRSVSTWFEDQLSTLISHEFKVPKKVAQTIVLSNQIYNESGLPFYKVTDVRYQEMKPSDKVTDVRYQEIKTPILPTVLNSTYKHQPGMVEIKSSNGGVQIILQDLVTPRRSCVSHPWHLHGHSFYVVARGEGMFDPNLHNKLIDAKVKGQPTPIFRDTFTLFPAGTPTTQFTTLPIAKPKGDPNSTRSCGWTAIRFRANNPGSWLMHCHITAHMVMGMQLLINELPI